MSAMSELDIEIKELKHELINLNFNARSIGLNYWIEVILLYKTNKKVEFIYNKIAKNHNVTRNSIERAMRTALRPARENIQSYYNYKGNITVKTFLNLIFFYSEKE